MKIVVFIHEASGESGSVLFNSISACQEPESLLRIQTLTALKAHLGKAEHHPEPEVLLLLAESRARLEALTGLGPLLEDRRLILVVPDNEPATLSAAHRLFPRFVAPLADQYMDLCSVMDQMLGRTVHT